MIHHDKMIPETETPPLPEPSADMLARRERALNQTAGAWSGPLGEQVARDLEELFERPEKDPPWTAQP